MKNRNRIFGEFAALSLVFGLGAANVMADAGAFDGRPVHQGMTVSAVNLGMGNVSTMGLGFLSNGTTLVLVTCQSANSYGGGDAGSQNADAAVYLVTGITGTASANKIASNFYQPSGVAIGPNDEIMVPDRDAVYRVSTTGTKTKVLDNPVVRAWHQWVFCPMYYNGRYYAAYSGTIVVGGGSNTNQSSTYSGAVLSWTSDGSGGFQKYAGGLRSPNGAGIGSGSQAGFMMYADNQGSWLPSCTFSLIRQNRFYGHRQNTGSTPNWAQANYLADSVAYPYDPPVAWMLDGQTNGGYGGAGQSTSQPLYMDRGPYQGDWIVGDANQQGIARVSLDPVNGGTGISAKYNGAVMWFTNGFGNTAPNRMIWHPTQNEIYVGTIGTLGNWPSSTAQPFYKIALNDATLQNAFEVLKVYSRANGVELVFSQPLQANVTAANFTVDVLRMARQDGYGAGNNLLNANIAVSQVQMSTDNRRVFLQIGNQGGIDRINHIRMNNLASSTGAALTSTFNRVWFTHNYQSTVAFSPTGTPISKRSQVDPFMASRVSHSMLRPGLLSVKVDLTTAYTVSLRAMNGAGVEEKTGSHPAEFLFQPRSSGVYVLEVRQAGHDYVRPVIF